LRESADNRRDNRQQQFRFLSRRVFYCIFYYRSEIDRKRKKKRRDSIVAYPILYPDVLLTPFQIRSSKDFARKWRFHRDAGSLVPSSGSHSSYGAPRFHSIICKHQNMCLYALFVSTICPIARATLPSAAARLPRGRGEIIVRNKNFEIFSICQRFVSIGGAADRVKRK